MLTDTEIAAFRITMSCCALDALDRYVEAMTYGDLECAKKERGTWLLLSWAAQVFMDVQLEGETGGCTTRAYASKVYNKVKCFCDCGCGGSTFPSVPCGPVVADTVIAAVDVNQRPAIEAGPPAVGDSYLVVTNVDNLSDVWGTNSIQTWSGSAWTPVGVVNGEVTQATDTGVFWVTYNSTTPGWLYPELLATLVGSAGEYEIVSQYPATSTFGGRTIAIRAIAGGQWVTVFTGPESAIATTAIYSFGGPAIGLEVIYYEGDCETTAGSEVVPPVDVCGDLVVVISADPNCGDLTFSVTVDIQDADGFPLGSIIPYINTVAQPAIPAFLGETILGPYGIDDTLVIGITNAFDPLCNYLSDPISNPQFPTADETVLQAVDASFQGSALAGEFYLIVSDTEDSGNLWASNVGAIVEGGTIVFNVPASGSIIQTITPIGPTSYWEMDGAVPVQVFPPVTFVYNTVTELWTVTPNPVAPINAGIDIVVAWTCPSSTDVVYSGPIGDFEETPFGTTCGVDDIEGRISYFPDCPVTVPAIIEEFTPTGDPDPVFGVPGPNLNVFDLAIESETQNTIIGGQFTAWTFGGFPADIPVGYLARVKPDGSLDEDYNDNLGTGFETGTAISGDVLTVALDSQNRAYAGGGFGAVNGNTAIGIARIDTYGFFDPTFVTGTGFRRLGSPSTVRDIAIMDDGSIICVGDFDEYNGTSCGFIAKLDPNGTLDPLFINGGITGFNNATNIVLIDPTDGSIVVGKGFFSNYNDGIGHPTAGIARLNPITGAFVGTITTGLINDSLRGISVQPDGKLIVTGEFTEYGTGPAVTVNYIMRLSSTGALDTFFKTGTGTAFEPAPAPPTAGAWTTKSLVMSNGQIIVAVYSPEIPTTFNGADSYGLVRLNTNGTRDLTFNPGPIGYNGRVNAIGQDELGRLVVAGFFTDIDGLTRRRIARIN